MYDRLIKRVSVLREMLDEFDDNDIVLFSIEKIDGSPVEYLQARFLGKIDLPVVVDGELNIRTFVIEDWLVEKYPNVPFVGKCKKCGVPISSFRGLRDHLNGHLKESGEYPSELYE